jgi:hypothetical protein
MVLIDLLDPMISVELDLSNKIEDNKKMFDKEIYYKLCKGC